MFVYLPSYCAMTNKYEDNNYDDWTFGSRGGSEQNINDIYTPYLFNASDIGSEYNLLNNFLNTNLLDEGPFLAEDVTQYPGSGQTTIKQTDTNAEENEDRSRETVALQYKEDKRTGHNNKEASSLIARGQKPSEREAEKFYMTIADPSGNDKPEERMKKLLEAKFKAGLLRPFNYVQGYARLNSYLEGHMQPALRQKMMRHIEKFRPKFREKMKSLTDMELTMVEMWFERTLMEYDRVFASMAIPACCWRRTGEIFRGNQAMADLIRVPVDKLRDVSPPLSVTFSIPHSYACRVSSHFTRSWPRGILSVIGTTSSL